MNILYCSKYFFQMNRNSSSTIASLNNNANILCGKSIPFHSLASMPRHTNKVGRPRDLDRPAEEAYDRLKWHEQYICYKYWNYKATRGREGWNPQESGSVNHQRTSHYLLSLGSDSWFRHLANKMVTLAEKFEQERKIPSQPYGEKIEPKKAKALPSTTAPAPDYPPIMPNLQSLVPPSTPTSRVTLDDELPGLEQRTEAYPPLSLPTTFGSYRKFNYTSRKKVERICVRILTHSAVELRDIEYSWVTPRILKLVVYWPEWFTFAEQMAMFVIDSNGKPVYPPDHPLTESFADNNAQLADEHQRIMDVGYIHFQKDMKESSFQIERLNIKIESKKILVRGIQIFAE
jgi:hypothetical protein